MSMLKLKPDVLTSEAFAISIARLLEALLRPPDYRHNSIEGQLSQITATSTQWRAADGHISISILSMSLAVGIGIHIDGLQYSVLL